MEDDAKRLYNSRRLSTFAAMKTTQSKIHTATDYLDDVQTNGKFFDAGHLDSLFKSIAAHGVTCHEWVINTNSAFVGESPVGFNLFSEVTQAAHRHGVEVHAVFKPFERVPHYAPHALPQPQPHVWSDLYGTLLPTPEFTVKNPQFCLQRRAGDEDRPGPITAIRLVRSDAKPTGLRREHFSIWTARRLGEWRQWSGEFAVSDAVDYRAYLTHIGDCRVVTLSGLSIPQSEVYIEVRINDDWQGESFGHHPDALVELVGEDGETLPATPGNGGSSAKSFKKFTSDPLLSQINPCMDDPEFAKFVRTEDLDALWQGHREIGWPWSVGARIDVAVNRCATVARGTLQRMPILHPGYPEVQDHWLGQIKQLLEAGFDGVNIRPSTHYHFRTTPPEAYGFNEIALARVENPGNAAAVAAANGTFFTEFLHRARELIVGQYHRTIGVHVLAPHFYDRDENGKQLDFALIDWQWQEWVRDIADYVEFRGLMGFRPLTGRLMIERVADTCRQHGKPLIVQSDRRIVASHQMEAVRDELQWAVNHPDISAYQLYETACFSRINTDDEIQWDDDFHELMGGVNPR